MFYGAHVPLILLKVYSLLAVCNKLSYSAGEEGSMWKASESEFGE
jgi:hypothetical protein